MFNHKQQSDAVGAAGHQRLMLNTVFSPRHQLVILFKVHHLVQVTWSDLTFRVYILCGDVSSLCTIIGSVVHWDLTLYIHQMFTIKVWYFDVNVTC